MRNPIQSSGVIVAFMMLGVSQHAASQPNESGISFDKCSLHGVYVYRKIRADVASFGILTFDGAGSVSLDLRVNLPSPDGETSRQTVLSIATGTYEVEPSGIGVLEEKLEEGPIDEGTYDFVIEKHENGARHAGVLCLPRWRVCRSIGNAGLDAALGTTRAGC